jgi:uncharacterized protein (TIGR02722 family)
MPSSAKLALWACVAMLIAVTAAGGCAKKVVSRIDADETVDLSGKWNDTDSRLVADEMIADCLGHPWLETARRRDSASPTIIAGSIRNKSLEHIAVGTFLKDIERAMVNSGSVQVVASAEERGDVRDEREDQRVNASPETLKEMGREVGADFMLLGEINQINDREGKEEIRFYQVDLTLVNIETNVKSWVGQKKIKKYVANRRYSP